MTVDPDDGLTPFHRTIQALHRAATRICETWPRALDELPDGYTSRGETHGTDTPDPTATAALNRTNSHAPAWLAELHDVTKTIHKAAHLTQPIIWAPEPVHHLLDNAINQILWDWTLEDIIDADPQSPNYRRDVFGLERLADQAARWWPPHPNGTPNRTQPHDTTENCGLCGMPTTTGRDTQGRLQTRRIDGQPFHTTAAYGHGACYYTVWRQRRTHAA